MAFKKILSLLLTFCMIFSFSACGNRNSDDEEVGTKKNSKQSSSDANSSADDNSNTSDNTDNKNTDEATKDNDSNNEAVSASENDSSPYADLKEVDLPKGYPEEAFPIYKGGKVYVANLDERDEVNVYSIMAGFGTDVDTLDEYYNDLLKDAINFDDQTSSGIISYSGELSGYNFVAMLIGDPSNKKYSSMTLELTEIPSANDVLKSLSEGELPDDYPVSTFPNVDGGAINSSNESESNDKISYDVTIYTDKSFKEIVAFYEESIGTIEDKSKSISTDYFELSGTADNYYFRISGEKVNENNVELVRFYIDLDPVE